MKCKAKTISLSSPLVRLKIRQSSGDDLGGDMWVCVSRGSWCCSSLFATSSGVLCANDVLFGSYCPPLIYVRIRFPIYDVQRQWRNYTGSEIDILVDPKRRRTRPSQGDCITTATTTIIAASIIMTRPLHYI